MSSPVLARRSLTRRAFTTGAATAALSAVAGCTGTADSPGPDGQGTPDRVRYLTAFGASAHDTFVFVADEKGFFADRGIEVEIELGQATANYPLMLAGEAQFSYTDLSGMFVDIGQGGVESGDFRALAAIHQRTLVAVVAPASSGIAAPADLEGKKIGAFTGSITELVLPTYAELSGWNFDPDQVETASAQELFGLLFSGNVDALSTFIIQRGFIESQLGEETVAFPLDQYLSDLLGTGLITTGPFAEENPDLVERFRDAALEGLRYMLDNPEEAIAILAERYPDAAQAPEALVGQIRVMTPYVTAEGEDRIGVLDEAHIVRCIHVLQGAGLVPPGLTPEDIIGTGTLLTSA